jgi:hypothetical protein
MFYKLNEEEKKTYKQVIEHTCTDYELKGDLIPVDNMFAMISDLLCEVMHLEDKFIDYANEVEANYILKYSDPYLENGVNERDFL